MPNGGCIDERGEEVIAQRFRVVEDFAAGGLAKVQESGYWAWIDRSGRAVALEAVLCGRNVLKNGRGDILWPQKTAEQICDQ
ncbi:MAG: WG repeat-containing protein [Azoarcus sp.]|jgi:hypothetical protein|nr:WG repeat-containing protein [Azoarcus sp.]